MRLLNIFEWFRDQEGFARGERPIADSLPELDGFVTEDEMHPDGTVYVTTYLHERAARTEAVHDYRRSDGSVYLRAPAGAARGLDTGDAVLGREQPGSADPPLADARTDGTGSGCARSPAMPSGSS